MIPKDSCLCMDHWWPMATLKEWAQYAGKFTGDWPSAIQRREMAPR